MTKLGKSICQLDKGRIAQGCSWAWFIFFVQIPFVYWYTKGVPAIHPIVIMLPLIGWLNFKVERKGLEGLGIRLVQPGHSLVLALFFSTLSATGWWISLRMNGLFVRIPLLTNESIWELVESFLIGVFIIALWEESVNRGYIQTRLQAAWGFWGVIVATLLFATMHIPSALLDYNNNLDWIVLRFLETGLAGFLFGYAYWRSGSVLTTIVIHGLNNFTANVFLTITGRSYQQLAFYQPFFQLVWLTGQVGLTAYLCHIFYKHNFRHAGDR
jgi:membrane protease YdiL (CAAX protease family)